MVAVDLRVRVYRFSGTNFGLSNLGTQVFSVDVMDSARCFLSLICSALLTLDRFLSSDGGHVQCSDYDRGA